MNRPWIRRLIQRSALLVLAGGSASLADAHAVLDQAVPAARSTVRASPKEVTLTFSQRLEPAFSGIRVFDAKGKQVDRADSRIEGAESTSLRVSLPALAPGRYRVSWRVLSIDSHVTQGEFTFDVAK